MRYTTTALIALAATAAAPSLAAPLAPITYNNADQACHYAGDKQHMVCTRDNHGYADGVPVTYDLGKRADAEVFLTRSDAYDVLARGMHDEMTAAKQAMQKRDAGDDVSFTIDHAGDLSKTKVTFSNGTVVPLSDLMVKQAAAPPPPAATHSKTTDDHSVNVGVGQGCKFGNGNINRRMATCQVAAVKRQVDQNYDGTSNGSNQGNICQFGNGNIGKRGSGASVRCTQNGSPTYGPNGGTTVIYGKRMAGSTGCKWYDQRSIGDEDAIEAHAELHRRQTGSNQGNVCQYGNQRRQSGGATYQCTQDCSPIYGPNGGSATYFTRRFDMTNADEVAAYHREVRAVLPNAAPLAARDEPCDGIPVGPVGPQVTYVTGKPQSKRDDTLAHVEPVAQPLNTFKPFFGHGPVVHPNGVPGFGPGPVIKAEKRLMMSGSTNVPDTPHPFPRPEAMPLHPGGLNFKRRAMPLEVDDDTAAGVPAKYRFRPLMAATGSTNKQPTATTNQKRCINTPIAPVGPSVTYESYDQWKSQHSS